MSVAAYPAYKESGVEWLGPVPSHWVPAKLKYALVEIGSGGTPDTSQDSNWAINDDGVPWVSIADMSSLEAVNCTAKALTGRGLLEKKLRIWPTGTLLFSMYASLGHVSVLAVPAAINQAILALVPSAETDQSFLRWWLKFLQPRLVEQANSNTQDNLNAYKVSNLPFIKIALPEQSAIATFLDRETAKIDALVAEQERLITLLAEKRQAVISHAVTKGLNPDAPMKDSGIEWLGQVPAHWEVRRFANLFSEAIEEGEQDLPVLSVSIHDGVSDRELADEELDRKVTRSDDRSKYKRVAPGDLVYNMMRAWQGGFGTVAVIGMVSPAYVVARPRQQFRTEFVELMLRAHPKRN